MTLHIMKLYYCYFTVSSVIVCYSFVSRPSSLLRDLHFYSSWLLILKLLHFPLHFSIFCLLLHILFHSLLIHILFLHIHYWIFHFLLQIWNVNSPSRPLMMRHYYQVRTSLLNRLTLFPLWTCVWCATWLYKFVPSWLLWNDTFITISHRIFPSSCTALREVNPTRWLATYIKKLFLYYCVIISCTIIYWCQEINSNSNNNIYHNTNWLNPFPL